MVKDQIILPSTFNRRILVKRAIPLTDSTGGTQTDFYETLFQTWASVEGMKTGRKVYLGIDAFTGAYDIQLRYTFARQLTVADLIDYLDGGVTKTLSITSVQLINQGYKMYYVLTANEVTVNG